MLQCAKILATLTFSYRRISSQLFRCQNTKPSSATNLRRICAMPSPNQVKDEEYLIKVISKRISLFQSLQSEQQARLQSLPHDPIK